MKRRRKMKKLIALLIASLMALAILSTITAPAQAAVSAPRCVKTAAEQAMRDSGMDCAFVIKVGAGGKGTGYMFYKNSKGKAICDRSGQVIIGKNTKIYKKAHYYFYRNFDFEYNNKAMYWTKSGKKYRQKWSINVTSEFAAFDFLVHGYVEEKVGSTWKIHKGVSQNRDGISMCQEFARYLRSCADPGCRVIFL